MTGTVAPESEMVRPLAVSVPPQKDSEVASAAMPVGSVSVAATPVSATVLAAGLVIVKVRGVSPPTCMIGSPNDLVMVGGATT